MSFTVADRDATAAAVERLGGTVLRRTDTDWTREALVRDPQGAEFTASQFTPPDVGKRAAPPPGSDPGGGAGSEGQQSFLARLSALVCWYAVICSPSSTLPLAPTSELNSSPNHTSGVDRMASPVAAMVCAE